MTGPSRALAADERDLGVYIHFPFCRHICPYCDFAVAVAPDEMTLRTEGTPERPDDDDVQGDYYSAVARELDERAADYAGRRLVSIYFGGGTPSLWQWPYLAELIGLVTGRFPRQAAELEITIEANPTDCTPATLRRWRDVGINRLSIGVQSLDPGELVALGRDHRMGDGASAVEAALAAGFPRVSADAILGIPGSLRPAASRPRASSTDMITRLAGFGAAGPGGAAARLGHLSVYELTIAERTAFGRAARAGTLRPISDEILSDLYSAVHDALGALGFEHYEISSYARPGERAVHNQLYWRGAEYLGLGNGAASFRLLDRASSARTGSPAGERVTNVRSVKRYLAAVHPQQRVADRELLDGEALAIDRLWLGLRTADGVAEDAFAPRRAVREWLVAEQLAVPRDGRICPTLKGFLFCDQIASRLFRG